VVIAVVILLAVLVSLGMVVVVVDVMRVLWRWLVVVVHGGLAGPVKNNMPVSDDVSAGGLRRRHDVVVLSGRQTGAVHNAAAIFSVLHARCRRDIGRNKLHCPLQRACG